MILEGNEASAPTLKKRFDQLAELRQRACTNGTTFNRRADQEYGLNPLHPLMHANRAADRPVDNA